MIFPIGNFKVIYSSEIEDLYQDRVSESDHLIKSLSRNLDFQLYLEDKWKAEFGEDNPEISLKDYAKDKAEYWVYVEGRIPKKILDAVALDIVQNGAYTQGKNRIRTAIRLNNEMMVGCDSYYAISDEHRMLVQLALKGNLSAIERK